MQLTRAIIEAMAEGYESFKFTWLLEQFGIWERYKGCLGYPSGHEAQTAHIDDDSALILDRCLQKAKHTILKGEKIEVAPEEFEYTYAPYKVYQLFYVSGFDENDIYTVLNPHPRKSDRMTKRLRKIKGIQRGPQYYGVDPAFAETMYIAGPDAYLQIKRRGDAYMYKCLMELKNDKDHE